jgi:hypothetical protein
LSQFTAGKAPGSPILFLDHIPLLRLFCLWFNVLFLDRHPLFMLRASLYSTVHGAGLGRKEKSWAPAATSARPQVVQT